MFTRNNIKFCYKFRFEYITTKNVYPILPYWIWLSQKGIYYFKILRTNHTFIIILLYYDNFKISLKESLIKFCWKFQLQEISIQLYKEFDFTLPDDLISFNHFFIMEAFKFVNVELFYNFERKQISNILINTNSCYDNK